MNLLTEKYKTIDEFKEAVNEASADWMATSKSKSGISGEKNVSYWVKGLNPKDPNRDEIGEAFYNALIKAVDEVSKKYKMPVKDVVLTIRKDLLK